jgi:hypothetical protein
LTNTFTAEHAEIAEVEKEKTNFKQQIANKLRIPTANSKPEPKSDLKTLSAFMDYRKRLDFEAWELGFLF